jgi:hypothetical protein
MIKKVLPKFSRYSLLLLATLSLTGVWYFKPNKRSQEAPSTVSAPVAASSVGSGGNSVVASSNMQSKVEVLPSVRQVLAQRAAEQRPVESRDVAKPAPAELSKVEAVAGKGWFEQAMDVIKASEYNIRWDDSRNAFQSPNRAQDLRVIYRNDGFALQPRVGGTDWNVSLTLADISGLKPTTQPITEVKENQLLVHHNGFTMQYLNNEAGMRQNFIVNERPSGMVDNNLEVRLNYTSTLAASLGDNQVVFGNASGEKVIYRDLKVWDASGKTLPATMKMEGSNVILAVNAANAQFPVTVDPISCGPDWTSPFIDAVSTSGTTRQMRAEFGFSVATVGNRTGRLRHLSLDYPLFTENVNIPDWADVVVGAPNYDGTAVDQGAVFVFYGSSTGPSTTMFNWFMTGRQAGEQFGYALTSGGNVHEPAFNGTFDNQATNLASGHADLVVGAPRFDHPGVDNIFGTTDDVIDAGRVYLWMGSPTGLTMTMGGDWATSNIGNSIVNSVALNGVGPLTPPGIFPGALLGHSVSAGEIFDIQWDGTGAAAATNGGGTAPFGSDIVVGAPNFTNRNGLLNIAAAPFGPINAATGTNIPNAQINNSGAIVVFFSSEQPGFSPATSTCDVYVATTNYLAANTDRPRFGFDVAVSRNLSVDVDQDGVPNEVTDVLFHLDQMDDIVVGAPYYESSTLQSDEGASYVIHSERGSSNNHVTSTFDIDGALGPIAAVNPCGYTAAGYPLELQAASTLVGRGSVAAAINATGAIVPGRILVIDAALTPNAADPDALTAADANRPFFEVLEGNQREALLGYSVAAGVNVSDPRSATAGALINNLTDNIANRAYDDNRDDIAVGVPYYRSSVAENEEGGVFLVYGSAEVDFNRAVTGATSNAQAATFYPGQAGATLFTRGVAAATVQTNAHTFANAVGTVNYTDQVDRKPNLNFLQSNQQGARFGHDVALSGDVDGTTDILANNVDGGIFTETGTRIGTAGAGAIRDFDNSVVLNGKNLSAVGELIVGAPYMEGMLTNENNEGMIFVYHGTTLSGVSPANRCFAEGNLANSSFGFSVAGTNDGIQSPVAPGLSSHNNGLSLAREQQIRSRQQLATDAPSALGRPRALSDIVVGSPAWDFMGMSSNSDEGRAFSFFGKHHPYVRAAGTEASPATISFCPGSAPVVSLEVAFLRPNVDQFRIVFREGTRLDTFPKPNQPAITFNPNTTTGYATVNLPTTIQTTGIAYTMVEIMVNTCCRFELSPLSIIANPTGITATIDLKDGIDAGIVRETAEQYCGSTDPLPQVVLTGGAVALNDVFRIKWSTLTGATFATVTRQADVTGTITTALPFRVTLTNAFFNENVQFRVDTIINITRNCTTVVTPLLQATATIIAAPSFMIEPMPYCPGTVPTVRVTINGLGATGATGRCWSLTYRVNSTSSEIFTTATSNGDGTFILSLAPQDIDFVTDPGFVPLGTYLNDVTIFPVQLSVRATATCAGGTPCLFGAPVIPTSLRLNRVTNRPMAEFDPAPISFCSGTMPMPRVRVNNVAPNQPWTIAWSETVAAGFVVPHEYGANPRLTDFVAANAATECAPYGPNGQHTSFDPRILITRGVGPGYFNLMDNRNDLTSFIGVDALPGGGANVGIDVRCDSIISPATGPNIQVNNTKYFIGWIAAAGCTTDRVLLSNREVDAIVRNPMVGSFTFNPVTPFCVGAAPAIRFNVNGVTAGEQFTINGLVRRFVRRTGALVEERRYTAASSNSNTVYTGSSTPGNPFVFSHMKIGNDFIPVFTQTQEDSIEYFFESYQAVGEILCVNPLVSVSLGTIATLGPVVQINPIPTFCLNTSPIVTVTIPAGNWTINYNEVSTQFGLINRTVTINAPVSGAYAITTSALTTNATYTILSAVQTGALAGTCPPRIGTSVTAFVRNDAVPSAMLNQTFFCAGTVPNVTVNVSNVPTVAIGSPQGTIGQWRLGYREGRADAPIRYTEFFNGGPRVNLSLRNDVLFPNNLTNPQVGNTDYFIAVVEVIGGCTRTYNNAAGEGRITAIARPNPNVVFVNPPAAVCPGNFPPLQVRISGVAVGEVYTLNWTEGGVARPAVSGVNFDADPFTITLDSVSAITAATEYRLTLITNNTSGCAFTPNPALTTINVAVTGSTPPAVTFASANYFFCPGTRPLLTVNVTGIANPSDQWTITYREVPNGPAQQVNGSGNPTNYAFFPNIQPNRTTTYQIISIRNDVTGCISSIGSSTTATLNNTPGVVTLTAVGTSCVGSLPNFSVNVPGGGDWTIIWLENGVNRVTTGTGTNFTLTPDPALYTTPGTRTVQLLGIITNSTCNPTVDPTVRTFNVIPGAPNASFNTANATAVCSGTVPMVNVNISPAGPYTITFRVNSGVNQVISGTGSMVNIGGTTPIIAATSYTIVSITAGGCTQVINSSVTVNVNAIPSAVFSATNFNYCVGTMPMLGVTVSGIDNSTDNWTVSYRENPTGPSQVVTGNGNSVGRMFMTSVMPGTVSPQTYQLLTIVNNVSGCVANLTSTATTTQSVTGGGSVTLGTVANVCAGSSPSVMVNVPVTATQSWTLSWSENGTARTTTGIGPMATLPTTPSLYTTPGPRTISLTGIMVNGAACQPTTGPAASFNVLPSATAAFAPGNMAVVCAGVVPMVNVQVTPTGGAGTLTFRVNGGAPMTMTYGATGIVNIGGATAVTTNQTYELISINNGTCTSNLTASFTLTVTPTITPTLTSTMPPMGCSTNGSITVRGGAAGLAYAIRNDATGVTSAFQNSPTDNFTFSSLQAGNYSVLVRDFNNCTATVAGINLVGTGTTVPTLVSVMAAGTTAATVTFTAVNGGSPYTIEFRPLPVGAPVMTQTVANTATSGNITTTVTGLTAGVDYEFRVRSACNATLSNAVALVTQSACAANAILAVPTGVSIETALIGPSSKTATVSWNKVTGAQGYVVAWRILGGNPNFSTRTLCDNQIADDPMNANRKRYPLPGTFLVGVTYEVQVRTQCQNCGLGPNAPGSSRFSFIVTFRTDAAGNVVSDVTGLNEMVVYPNPNNGSFTVSYNSTAAGSVEMMMVDMTGRPVINRVYDAQVGGNQIAVEANGFAAGVYLLQIKQGESVQTTKVVLN